MNPRSGAIEERVDLDALVPRYLVHEPFEARGDDIYHFNSLHFDERGQLCVLAHNWDRGAFVLVLDPQSFSLTGSYTNLGRESHDVFEAGGELYSLDSRGGQLVEARSNRRYALQDAGHFPRGLAANDRNFFIGLGRLESVREKRALGQSGLAVWSRETHLVEREIPLGNYGDVCDVLLLSEPDLTDRG